MTRTPPSYSSIAPDRLRLLSPARNGKLILMSEPQSDIDWEAADGIRRGIADADAGREIPFERLVEEMRSSRNGNFEAIFPGIESRPNVCGGEPCIVRTRIPVWLLEEARRQGVTDAALLEAYPSLWASGLANAWEYGHSHKSEIETQIAENKTA